MAIDPFSDDDLLVLKKRARRRLVGAVALSLLAILILSIVVDKTPPAKKPSPEAPVAIEGMKPDSVAKAPEPLAASAVAVEPRVLPPAQPVAESPRLPAPQAAKPVSAPQEKPPVKPEPVARAEKPPKVEAAVKPVLPEKKPARAEADKPKTARQVEKILDDQPEAPPKPAKVRLTAQIAALSSEEKAKGLQAKLAAHGIPSTTQTVTTNGRTVVRVKIGPFDSAEALKKAHARAAQMGL